MKSNSSNGQAANAMEDVVCAVTSSEVVFKLFNVESDAAVVVLKKFDDLRWIKVAKLTNDTNDDKTTFNLRNNNDFK